MEVRRRRERVHLDGITFGWRGVLSSFFHLKPERRLSPPVNMSVVVFKCSEANREEKKKKKTSMG